MSDESTNTELDNLLVLVCINTIKTNFRKEYKFILPFLGNDLSYVKLYDDTLPNNINKYITDHPFAQFISNRNKVEYLLELYSSESQYYMLEITNRTVINLGNHIKSINIIRMRITNDNEEVSYKYLVSDHPYS